MPAESNISRREFLNFVRDVSVGNIIYKVTKGLSIENADTVTKKELENVYGIHLVVNEKLPFDFNLTPWFLRQPVVSELKNKPHELLYIIPIDADEVDYGYLNKEQKEMLLSPVRQHFLDLRKIAHDSMSMPDLGYFFQFTLKDGWRVSHIFLAMGRERQSNLFELRSTFGHEEYHFEGDISDESCEKKGESRARDIERRYRVGDPTGFWARVDVRKSGERFYL